MHRFRKTKALENNAEKLCNKISTSIWDRVKEVTSIEIVELSYRKLRDSENAAVNRKRQIDTLKVFNDNVTEIQDVEYRVEFNVGGYGMAILVSLSPEFPLEKPVLKVTPQTDHPWVNEQSEIISAPGLLNFTVHSDLGRVVQTIIREFERRPPPLAGDVAVGTSTQQRVQEACTNGRAYVMPTFPPVYPSSECFSFQNY
ncbi:hypothetical protein ANN_08402 [Periplaneta americana]|uniref:Uncharacterized protein n=1 Tax=Periplaneta americana TaxID=6978 RepID=A0ABQ8T1B3_PERAM|nr:hypothetical protein ANN_08402 [Periplaneta americana]